MEQITLGLVPRYWVEQIINYSRPAWVEQIIPGQNLSRSVTLEKLAKTIDFVA